MLLLTQTILLQRMFYLPRVERLSRAECRGCEGMLFPLAGLFQDVWFAAGFHDAYL